MISCIRWKREMASEYDDEKLNDAVSSQQLLDYELRPHFCFFCYIDDFCWEIIKRGLEKSHYMYDSSGPSQFEVESEHPNDDENRNDDFRVILFQLLEFSFCIINAA